MGGSKKIVCAVVGALTLALILPLSGTFGWQSVSQSARNEVRDGSYVPPATPTPPPTPTETPMPSSPPTPTPSETPIPSAPPSPTPSETPTPGAPPAPSETPPTPPSSAAPLPPNVPKTGDERMPALWIALALVSIVGLFCCAWYGKKHRYRGKRVLK